MGSFYILDNKGDLLPLGEFTTDETAKFGISPEHRRLGLVERIELARALADRGLNSKLTQAATILLSTNPTATDTITIGTDVYEFVAAAGQVADDANIAVEIKGSAALTQAELVAAINGTADAEHPTIFLATAGTTPAVGRGTMSVAAEVDSDVLYVSYTNVQGRDPSLLTLADWKDLPATLPSLPTTDTLTAAVAWNVSNMNVLHWFNPAVTNRAVAGIRHVVTAADIASGSVIVETGLDTSVEAVMSVQVLTTLGAMKVVTDTFKYDSGEFIITFGGGTPLAAGDEVHATLVGIATDLN